MQWLCCKCESINVPMFTFHSYELNASNYYEPLTHNITFESIASNTFNPLKASSPKRNNSASMDTSKCKKSKSRNNSSNVFNIPTERNLRIMTLNCRSINDKTSEFTAVVIPTKPFASKFQCGPLKISSQLSTWRVKIRKNKIV